jgi:tetratricopeptide (TPR) repeat protein
VQYYGEHVDGDGRLDSLPQMLDLVTTLSPHFIEPYLFSTFALADAGQVQKAYDLLRKGFEANPGDWHLPFQLGFMAYTYGKGKLKARAAAIWFDAAAKLPGSPPFVRRLAAGMLLRGGETEKAILMWGQIYAQGDKYSKNKAIESLDYMLPKEKEARMKAVAPLYRTMPRAAFYELVAALT